LEKDILAQMAFKPQISETLKTMDLFLFTSNLMQITQGTKERCAAK
jgi:propionate CoA-transferase